MMIRNDDAAPIFDSRHLENSVIKIIKIIVIWTISLKDFHILYERSVSRIPLTSVNALRIFSFSGGYSENIPRSLRTRSPFTTETEPPENILI